MATTLNTLPRYVASTTLTDPEWADSRVIEGDVAPVRRLFSDNGTATGLRPPGRLVFTAGAAVFAVLGTSFDLDKALIERNKQ